MCTNVEQTVKGSLHLQARLTNFYCANVPGYPLGFENITSAQMLRWLDEWRTRSDRLQPHSAMRRLHPGGFKHVQSDGGVELFKRDRAVALSEAAAFAGAAFVLRDSNVIVTGNPSPSAQSRGPVSGIWAYKTDGDWFLAKISVQDELLVVVYAV